jgi:hypothetical protein
MGKFISNVTTAEGYKVIVPRPIDDRRQWDTLSDLIEYSQGNGFFTLYEGLTVYVYENKTHYKWVESEHGLLKRGDWPYEDNEIAPYPPNYRPIGDDGPDYSNRFFNWVVADESVVLKITSNGSSIIEIPFDVLPDKMINRPDNTSAYMANVVISTGTSGETFFPHSVEWDNNERLKIKVYPAFVLGQILTIKIS